MEKLIIRKYIFNIRKGKSFLFPFLLTLFFVHSQIEGWVELDAGITATAARLSYRAPFTGKWQGVSKLKWDDIYAVALATEGRWYWGKRGYCRLMTDIGSVAHATSIDIDNFYDEPFIKQRYSRSSAASGDAEYIVVDFALGRRYSPFSSRFFFIPALGFSFREIGFTMTNGRQDYLYISKWLELHNQVLKDLCSSYDVRWYSPWIGFDFGWNRSERWLIRGKYELQLYLETVNAYWDLRNLHFHEHYPGASFVFEIGSFYQFSPLHYWGIKLGYQFCTSVEVGTEFYYDPPEGSLEYANGEKIVVDSPKFRCVFENIYVSFLIHRTF